jgi:hypothetical protein
MAKDTPQLLAAGERQVAGPLLPLRRDGEPEHAVGELHAADRPGTAEPADERADQGGVAGLPHL